MTYSVIRISYRITIKRMEIKMKILRIKTRTLWGFNSVTRRVPSKKRYVRSRNKAQKESE